MLGSYGKITFKVTEEEIKKNNEYASSLLDVSNDIIIFDLLKKDQTDENKVIEAQEKGA